LVETQASPHPSPLEYTQNTHSMGDSIETQKTIKTGPYGYFLCTSRAKKRGVCEYASTSWERGV